ncbi:MAG TPA: hypothetical protein VHA07_11275 [Devosia sp.]|nr:hypothetical protein [Devosia sp.]
MADAATAAGLSESAAGPREVRAAGAETSPPKTAVIVVHGMGEQKPLDTIKSFVETVYQRGGADPSRLRQIAIVPDTAFDSAELRRLSTQKDGPAKRTDFFEFYWADIMDGTPVEMVQAWIDMLLLRSPWRVPWHWRVYLAWFLLWVLALLVLFCAIGTVYPQLADSFGPLPGLLKWVREHHSVIGQAGYVLGIVSLALAVGKGLRGGARRIEATPLWTPFILLAGGLALAVWPESFIVDTHLLMAAVTAGLAWLMHAVVAPFLGDVVRYVRANPSTVERRRLIRARGLALLEAIHAKRADSSTQWNFTKAEGAGVPAYDRIVIVAHSLGTMVAYDILQMFWEKYGPTHHQDWDADADQMQDRLDAVDRFVRQQWVDRPPRPFELADFLTAQDELREKLRQQSPHWRLTDFITLGSPLVHAEFLAADGAADLKSAFEQRRFATCPPHPDPLLGSMLYPVREGGPRYPHFAAQFAAVRWTNICDETWFPLFGDLVSGQLRPIFGNGIVEYNDAIRRPWPFTRVFTHTQYWTWNDRYLKTGIPDHIRHLRDALKLDP